MLGRATHSLLTSVPRSLRAYIQVTKRWFRSFVCTVIDSPPSSACRATRVPAGGRSWKSPARPLRAWPSRRRSTPRTRTGTPSWGGKDSSTTQPSNCTAPPPDKGRAATSRAAGSTSPPPPHEVTAADNMHAAPRHVQKAELAMRRGAGVFRSNTVDSGFAAATTRVVTACVVRSGCRGAHGIAWMSRRRWMSLGKPIPQYRRRKVR